MAHWLFVTSQANNTPKGSQSAGDQVLANLLDGTDAASSRADTITWRSQSTAPNQATDESTYDGVLISETCSSGTVGSKYGLHAIPVISMEAGAWDDIDLSTAGGGNNPSADMYPIDTAHYIAAGFTGLTNVSSTSDMRTVTPAQVGAGVERVWVDSDLNTDPTVIFAYDAGAALADSSTAAARRIAIGWMDATCANLTSDGKAIFLASVEWALGEDTPPVGGGNVFVPQVLTVGGQGPIVQRTGGARVLHI